MFYVKVRESFNLMNTILKQDINKNKISTFSKSDLNKYLVDKNQIRKYPSRIWFKGSRYR